VFHIAKTACYHEKRNLIEHFQGYRHCFVTQGTYSRLYKWVVNPIVYKYWEEQQADIIATCPKEDVRLTGDGQFDSPGIVGMKTFFANSFIFV